VTHVSPQADGTFEVSLSTRETRLYDAVLVANGHHRDPADARAGVCGRRNLARTPLALTRPHSRLR
jgi:hypothetical protein